MSAPGSDGPRSHPPGSNDDPGSDAPGSDDPGGPTEAPEPSGSVPIGRAHHRRWAARLRLLIAVVLVVVVVLVLHDKLPTPAEVWAAFTTANWWWVAGAALLEGLSLASMVVLQRRMLRAFGVRVSFGHVGAISTASTAMSMSLPAGGAVSTGYTFQQFRRSGASRGTAVSVLLLSGILSTVGLALLYLAGLLLTAVRPLWTFGSDHPLVLVLIGVALLAAIELVVRLLSRNRPGREPSTRPTPRLDRWQGQHRQMGAAARHALETLRQARVVRAQDWTVALHSSVANWALDLGCLWLCCLAMDIRVHPAALAALYLGVQIVRQVPLTPGGIGVIEAALLAGLISVGAAQAPAAAAVVLYRLLSAWLLIPIGYAVMAVLQRRSAGGSPGAAGGPPAGEASVDGGPGDRDARTAEPSGSTRAVE